MRITLILAAVVLAVGTLAAGCGGGGDDSTGGGAGTATTTANSTDLFLGKPSKALCEGEDYSLGYDAFADATTTDKTIREGAERVADEIGCVDLVTTVNNADPTTALNNARTFAGRHVDGAVLFNLTPAAAAGQIKVLDDAGAASVLIGASAPGAPFVTVDEKKAGRTAGVELAKAFSAKYPGESPYVLVGRADEAGAVYVEYMDEFVDGIRSVIANVPQSQVIELSTKADPAVAQGSARAALGRVPSSAPVLAMSIDDPTTAAILQAVKQDNRSGPVMVISGRGGEVSRDLVCGDPEWVGTVDYHFDRWADYFMPALIDVVQGKEVPDEIQVPLSYEPREELC